jgi:hypothetical protein
VKIFFFLLKCAKTWNNISYRYETWKSPEITKIHLLKKKEHELEPSILVSHVWANKQFHMHHGLVRGQC